MIDQNPKTGAAYVRRGRLAARSLTTWGDADTSAGSRQIGNRQ
jgi:hypothetical protein